MTKNPNTVPTVITDKNGKVTTVHKRSNSLAKRSSIPAPGKKPKYDPQIALDYAYGQLAFAGFVDSSEPGKRQTSVNFNLRTLSEESNDLLIEVVDHLSATEGDDRKNWQWLLMSRKIYDPAEKKTPLNSVESYRRHMAVNQIASRICSHHPGYSMESVSGIAVWKAERFVDPSHDDDDYSKLKATVIVMGMKGINSAEPKDIEVETDDLWVINYISKNVDRVVDVLDELVDRRTTDPDVIEQLINSQQSQALARGTL